jgi:wyosine [tRNA(Phe)-imidazoG37] synthetase (radical SAM superfamily)
MRSNPVLQTSPHRRDLWPGDRATAIVSEQTPLSETDHPRSFREGRYVYPVLSRRAGGISVGINLNPDKACNFDCIYCQVDRSKPPADELVELDVLCTELRTILTALQPGGALWHEPEFASLPPDKQSVADIAFSGDGEPTTFRNFGKIVRATVEIKEALGFDNAKVILITNATGLHRPDVQEALRLLDAHRGEVWAKLDAGTEAYYRLIDRTYFPFEKIFENIRNCGRERPIVIQSCFVKVREIAPDPGEIAAFVERLRALTKAGARIQLVQVHTAARRPAYGIVSSLSNADVDTIAQRVRDEAGLEARAFYGDVQPGQGLMGEEPS